MGAVALLSESSQSPSLGWVPTGRLSPTSLAAFMAPSPSHAAMSEVDTNDSPPYMNVEDTYVIISHKGDDPPTPVPTAQSFIRRMNLDEGEEIEVLWDHASFEDDIRMSFATGRDGIWRQFLVDLPREDLHVRGVKTADPSVATDAMCNLLRDVVKKR
eukprot:Sspe_Gene.10631::Locus_3558_Transcript_1_2_Confidence_0.500_Length_2102::g.10631::m.10631